MLPSIKAPSICDIFYCSRVNNSAFLSDSNLCSFLSRRKGVWKGECVKIYLFKEKVLAYSNLEALNFSSWKMGF
jgi:hypothetical protein